jgi:hypothetical protein
MAAVRLSFTWFGTSKSLSVEQKQQAAEPFGAEAKSLSASKRLLDTSHPAFRAVTRVKSTATNLWRGLSLPYPESGIRLIRQDDVERFDAQMTDLRVELDEAVEQLDRTFDELKSQARERLGRLYNPGDYPDSLRGLFAVEWDFPSVEPPNFLRELSPELYQAELQRVQSRFDEAVQLAEQAFTDELAKLVSHLADRLAGDTDGKPKVFRDSAVGNLREFFDRFKHLGVRSNDELDRLVSDCQQLVSGVDPQSLRDNASLRQVVTQGLGQIQSSLDELLVDKPRRAIIRKPR